MKIPIIKSKWEYEVKKREGEGLQGYGYELRIFQNDMLVYRQGGYGAISTAEASARDYFLSNEFNIDREE
jgi:hypothetical protein